MKVKNGSRYQEEKKDRKDNRICSKDEVDLEGGGSSTKTSTRRDEKAGRQEKERGRTIEEDRLSDAEYKRFKLSIQRMTSDEINRLLCETIYY